MLRAQDRTKLQIDGSAGGGGDSLSPEHQAHRAGDKLFPPRKLGLEAAVGWPSGNGSGPSACAPFPRALLSLAAVLAQKAGVVHLDAEMS